VWPTNRSGCVTVSAGGAPRPAITYAPANPRSTTTSRTARKRSIDSDSTTDRANLEVRFRLGRYRLGVRTRGSQPRDRGSNPRTAKTYRSVRMPIRSGFQSTGGRNGAGSTPDTLELTATEIAETRNTSRAVRAP